MDDALITRVHNLPPELYNQIRAEVLEPDIPISSQKCPVITQVNASFKFPVQLHVDRTTRSAFQAKFLTDVYFESDSVDLLSLKMIGRISYLYDTVPDPLERSQLVEAMLSMEEKGVRICDSYSKAPASGTAKTCLSFEPRTYDKDRFARIEWPL